LGDLLYVRNRHRGVFAESQRSFLTFGSDRVFLTSDMGFLGADFPVSPPTTGAAGADGVVAGVVGVLSASQPAATVAASVNARSEKGRIIETFSKI
jgi:hypothetical protein